MDIRMQSTGDLHQAFRSGTHHTACCFKEGDVISPLPLSPHSLTLSTFLGEEERQQIFLLSSVQLKKKTSSISLQI